MNFSDKAFINICILLIYQITDKKYDTFKRLIEKIHIYGKEEPLISIQFIAELTHLIVDTFLLKVEAEDRLLLALDPENYEKENIKTAFIVTISFMTPVLIPEPRLY